MSRCFKHLAIVRRHDRGTSSIVPQSMRAKACPLPRMTNEPSDNRQSAPSDEVPGERIASGARSGRLNTPNMDLHWAKRAACHHVRVATSRTLHVIPGRTIFDVPERTIKSQRATGACGRSGRKACTKDDLQSILIVQVSTLHTAYVSGRNKHDSGSLSQL